MYSYQSYDAAAARAERESRRTRRARLAAEQRARSEALRQRRERELDAAYAVMRHHLRERPLTTAMLLRRSEREPDLARALQTICLGRGGVQPYALGAALREARKVGRVAGEPRRGRPTRWSAPGRASADTEGRALVVLLDALWREQVLDREGLTARELLDLARDRDELRDAFDELCPHGGASARRLGQRLSGLRGRTADVDGRTLALASRPGAGHMQRWEAAEVDGA